MIATVPSTMRVRLHAAPLPAPALSLPLTAAMIGIAWVHCWDGSEGDGFQFHLC